MSPNAPTSLPTRGTVAFVELVSHIVLDQNLAILLSMATKSPSMAFEPTPALELNKENFSPLTEDPNSSAQHDHRERSSSKEVHFSPVMSPARRAQSLATSVPFLEPISSASRLPRQNGRVKSMAPEVDMTAYMEQSRSLLESQRLNFDREREVFAKERKLWNAERSMLKARIADLEFSLNKNNAARRRFSNDASSASAHSFREDVGQNILSNGLRTLRGSSDSGGPPPVWETPDMGSTVTRVFSNEEQQPQPKKLNSIPNGLPSIPEGATEKLVSPRSVPVPVALLDSSLDGITLRSAGLESSFVKVSSPTSTSPRQLPSPGPRIDRVAKTLRMDLDVLPPNINADLVKDAGHTPMALDKPVPSETASGVESRISPDAGAVGPAPERESAPDLGQSRPPLPPSERSDSYFSSALQRQITRESLDDGDVELKGPLIMANEPKEGQENAFLSQLDAKLLAESQRPQRESRADIDEKKRDGFVKIEDEVDDGGPRLKLKKSMNFGSAFGSKNCGNI